MNSTNEKINRYISKEDDSGLLWFAESSNHYVNPKGLVEHLSFFMALPGATMIFMKLMNED